VKKHQLFHHSGYRYTEERYAWDDASKGMTPVGRASMVSCLGYVGEKIKTCLSGGESDQARLRLYFYSSIGWELGGSVE
jgi:hypothetical protein